MGEPRLLNYAGVCLDNFARDSIVKRKFVLIVPAMMRRTEGNDGVVIRLAPSAACLGMRVVATAFRGLTNGRTEAIAYDAGTTLDPRHARLAPVDAGEFGRLSLLRFDTSASPHRRLPRERHVTRPCGRRSCRASS